MAIIKYQICAAPSSFLPELALGAPGHLVALDVARDVTGAGRVLHQAGGGMLCGQPFLHNRYLKGAEYLLFPYTGEAASYSQGGRIYFSRQRRPPHALLPVAAPGSRPE